MSNLFRPSVEIRKQLEAFEDTIPPTEVIEQGLQQPQAFAEHLQVVAWFRHLAELHREMADSLDHEINDIELAFRQLQGE